MQHTLCEVVLLQHAILHNRERQLQIINFSTAFNLIRNISEKKLLIRNISHRREIRFQYISDRQMHSNWLQLNTGEWESLSETRTNLTQDNHNLCTQQGHTLKS